MLLAGAYKEPGMQGEDLELIIKGLSSIYRDLLRTGNEGNVCLDIKGHPFSQSVRNFYCLDGRLLGLAF
jgi:hypothetical protein